MNGPRSHHPDQDRRVVSTLANDPEMLELVDYFLSELPERVLAVRDALEASDMATLKRLVHQLRGAAGGYGFPSIGDSAADVERVVLERDADVNELRERVESFINLCRRATTQLA